MSALPQKNKYRRRWFHRPPSCGQSESPP
jgi:predicted DNA-binding ribbon-helix-helix protein